MDTESLQLILEKHCEELRILESSTILIKSKKAITEDLLNIRADVFLLHKGTKFMRKTLAQMKEQNESLQKYKSLMEDLDKKILHMHKNVSEKLIKDYKIATEKKSKEKPLPRMPAKVCSGIIVDMDIDKEAFDCKKKLFRDSKVFPSIQPLMIQEFNKIPKYIIGRQSIETINNFVNVINNVLESKYKILSLGKVQAKKLGQLNLYIEYKKQEYDVFENKENLHFFTKEDYEKQTKTRLDKIKLNFLTALRFCERIRECRDNKSLKYILVTKDY